jgi:hypothetical protein
MKKPVVDTPWANSWADQECRRKGQPVPRVAPATLPCAFREQQVLMNVQHNLGTAGCTQIQAEAAYAAEKDCATG